MRLIQEDMIVVEYEKKFTELAKYVLAFVIDEADKCKCFKDRIKIEIQAL